MIFQSLKCCKYSAFKTLYKHTRTECNIHDGYTKKDIQGRRNVDKQATIGLLLAVIGMEGQYSALMGYRWNEWTSTALFGMRTTGRGAGGGVGGCDTGWGIICAGESEVGGCR